MKLWCLSAKFIIDGQFGYQQISLKLRSSVPISSGIGIVFQVSKQGKAEYSENFRKVFFTALVEGDVLTTSTGQSGAFLPQSYRFRFLGMLNH